VTVLISTRSVA